MGEDGSDVLHQVEEYRRLVLLYEALDEEIDALIMQHGGTADRMPPEALKRYRDLARQRDELQNEIRLLEQKLLPDDNLDE